MKESRQAKGSSADIVVLDRVRLGRTWLREQEKVWALSQFDVKVEPHHVIPYCAADMMSWLTQ